MNTKIVLWILVLLLMIGSASADVHTIWKDECNSGNAQTNDWTSDVSYSGGNCITTDVVEGNDNINISMINNSIDWTLSVKAKQSAVGGTDLQIYGLAVNVAGWNTVPKTQFGKKGNECPGQWFFHSGGGTECFGTQDTNWNLWEFKYFTNDTDDMYIYKNGTLAFHSASGINGTGMTAITLITNNQDIQIDWINLTWDDGLGGTDYINISSPFPTNNTQYSSSLINFNATINSTNTTNVILYINDTLSETKTYSAGTDVPVNFSKTVADGDWTFYIFVNDSMTSNDTTATHEFYVDNTNPTITWIYPSSLNNTVFSGNMTSNITIADNNLYSYEYNITYMNGTTFNSYNFSDSSLTGNTTVTINETFNMTTLGGEFKAVTRVCDGHTKEFIEPFNVIEQSDKLIFDEVSIKSLTTPEDISYLKKNDRYSFSFKYSTPRTQIQIEVPSECNYIGSKTDYLGHFVCGEKWIDFEGPYTVSVFKNIVTINSKTPLSIWDFNSIGELNCITEEIEFFSVNHTIDYSGKALSGTTSAFYFNLTYDSDWIETDSISTDLVYNGTSYSMTESCGTTVCEYSKSITIPTFTNNISFYYTYDLNGTEYNSSELTQEVLIPAIDNCTIYNTTFINFTLRDELNSTVLTGDIDYLFEWTVGTYSNTFNSTETAASYFDFCIFPDWSNFTTEITLQYAVSGYDPRDFVDNNYQADNASEDVNLYSLVAGQSTEVTIHVIDDSDGDISNVFIKAFRWDIPTDTELLVESEYTDSDGNALFDLKVGTEYYKFEFYQGGELKLTTSRFKLFSSTLEYILSDVESNALQEWLLISSMIYDLTYTDSSKLFTFTWNDENNVADKYCFNVSDSNTTYLSNCSTVSSGTMEYTISVFNRTYTALTFARHSSAQNWYALDMISINTYDNWSDNFGVDDTLAFCWIIFTFVGLIFVDNKNAAIVGSCGALLILYFFGALPSTVGITVIIGVIALGVIAMLIMNKRQSFQ